MILVSEYYFHTPSISRDIHATSMILMSEIVIMQGHKNENDPSELFSMKNQDCKIR